MKTGVFWHFFPILMVFQSLCLSGVILAQKLNTFIFEKQNLGPLGARPYRFEQKYCPIWLCGTVITNFYELHLNKGKGYTFKNFKKFGVHLRTGKHLSNELKSSKKRLIKILSSKCWKIERRGPCPKWKWTFEDLNWV